MQSLEILIHQSIPIEFPNRVVCGDRILRDRRSMSVCTVDPNMPNFCAFFDYLIIGRVAWLDEYQEL